MNMKELHSKALSLVATYKKAEAELLEIFLILDQKKSFRELGYTSLFLYATQGLKLSESTAYNLITVSRKSREVPMLKKEIELGRLSVTNARRIAPILTVQNQEAWIEKAKMLPQKKLEHEIARAYPKQAVREEARYVSETRIELKLGISAQLHSKLKRAQDLECQSKRKAVGLEEMLDAVLDLYLERKDPVKKAERTKQEKLGVRRVVQSRDRGRCTAMNPAGEQCLSERWVDIHHVQPRSSGGKDVAENLTTLCRAHHQMAHR